MPVDDVFPRFLATDTNTNYHIDEKHVALWLSYFIAGRGWFSLPSKHRLPIGLLACSSLSETSTQETTAIKSRSFLQPSSNDFPSHSFGRCRVNRLCKPRWRFLSRSVAALFAELSFSTRTDVLPWTDFLATPQTIRHEPTHAQVDNNTSPSEAAASLGAPHTDRRSDSTRPAPFPRNGYQTANTGTTLPYTISRPAEAFRSSDKRDFSPQMNHWLHDRPC